MTLGKQTFGVIWADLLLICTNYSDNSKDQSTSASQLTPPSALLSAIGRGVGSHGIVTIIGNAQVIG